MAGLREKGKIPRNEWPTILAKYRSGETMAQIGRDYGCTAPAIRYIVKRSGMLTNGAPSEPAAAAGTRARRPSRAGAPAATGNRSASARAQPAPATVAPSSRPVRDHVLGPELRQRVGGDVASFLVALDHAVLEGSLESVANLQEATDRLMRSTARTRLELERLLRRHEVAGARGKAGSSQRGA